MVNLHMKIFSVVHAAGPLCESCDMIVFSLQETFFPLQFQWGKKSLKTLTHMLFDISRHDVRDI